MTGVGGGAMERKARRRTRGEMASMRSASVLRRAKAEAARSMGRNSALAKSGKKPKMMVPMRAANWRRTSGARRRERRGLIEGSITSGPAWGILARIRSARTEGGVDEGEAD